MAHGRGPTIATDDLGHRLIGPLEKGASAESEGTLSPGHRLRAILADLVSNHRQSFVELEGLAVFSCEKLGRCFCSRITAHEVSKPPSCRNGLVPTPFAVK